MSNRFAYPWWKEKIIDSEKKRKAGSCPLTPEETALALRALDIDPGIQVYIAAGDIYGGERRMASLRLAFPHMVSCLNLTKQVVVLLLYMCMCMKCVILVCETG